MEKLTKRYNVVIQTLDTLKTAMEKLNDPQNKENYVSFRDSLVQRFEYSIDNFWKFLKIYLQQKHAILTSGSPRDVLRDVFTANIITKDEFNKLVKCIRDRSLTSHTYNEPLAEEIANTIPEYYRLMKEIIKRIEM